MRLSALSFPPLLRLSVFPGTCSWPGVGRDRNLAASRIGSRVLWVKKNENEPLAPRGDWFDMKKGPKQMTIASFFGGAKLSEKKAALSQPSVSKFFGTGGKLSGGAEAGEIGATSNAAGVENEGSVPVPPSSIALDKKGDEKFEPSSEASVSSEGETGKRSPTRKKRRKLSPDGEEDSETKSDGSEKRKSIAKPRDTTDPKLNSDGPVATKRKRLKKVSELSQKPAANVVEKSVVSETMSVGKGEIPSDMEIVFKNSETLDLKEQFLEAPSKLVPSAQGVSNVQATKPKSPLRRKKKSPESTPTQDIPDNNKLDEISIEKEKIKSVFDIHSDSSSSSDNSGASPDGVENESKLSVEDKPKVVRKRKSTGTSKKATGVSRKGKLSASLDPNGAPGSEDATLDGNQALKENKTLSLKINNLPQSESANWKASEPVPFLFLAEAFERISNESGRIVITEIMRNVFQKVMEKSPDDLLPILYLAGNRIAPPHEGIELGIGDSSIIKALAEATGKKDAQITKEYKSIGDLGSVAKLCRSNQPCLKSPVPLTCRKVFESLRFIANLSGPQSNDKKREKIKQLIVSAKDLETQYIIRLLQGKMRIGLAEQTLLVSLAHASVLFENKNSENIQNQLEQAVSAMKTAYSVLPVYEKIVSTLQTHGWSKLTEYCQFTPGIPISPMLAKPTKGISEILDKFSNIVFTCEYKYDGERAQIHYLENGEVEIYSRNAERNTGKFPDLIDVIKKYKKDDVNSFVIDSEVVAYDREKDRILPFQILSTRARKGVIISDIKIQICIFAFDCLYLNGKPLLQEQLVSRREYLRKAFSVEKGYLEFATSIETRDIDEMQTFLNDSVNHGCEGCMVKTLVEESTYEPSKRSNNWLKLKKDYMDDLGDSFDLVPIGAFHGRGKRTGLYGAFLLACYDPDAEEYQSICKIGTGFSDSVLEARSTSLRNSVIDKPLAYYRFGEGLGVDVWFQPSEVWEVKAADLSISPVHRAANGIVDESKGIALRFPRFLRLREDKTPENATTSEQVAELYRAQKIHHNDD